jgi:outer membrane protein with beta-barrel domain
MKSALVLGALALVAIPCAALANQPIKVGISGFGGFHSYRMSDVNEQIDSVNVDPGLLGGSGTTLDKISKGFGLGGGIHAWVTDAIFLSVDYERLFAKSSASGTNSGTAFDLDLNAPANAVTLSGAYFFPMKGKIRYGLGAGVGYYKAAASLKYSSASFDSSSDVKGHAIGFHGVGRIDYPAASNVHVEVQAGYRYAKTTNIEINGDEIVNADGSKQKIDWSGLLSRAGITYYFGNKE